MYTCERKLGKLIWKLTGSICSGLFPYGSLQFKCVIEQPLTKVGFLSFICLSLRASHSYGEEALWGERAVVEIVRLSSRSPGDRCLLLCERSRSSSLQSPVNVWSL